MRHISSKGETQAAGIQIAEQHLCYNSCRFVFNSLGAKGVTTGDTAVKLVASGILIW